MLNEDGSVTYNNLQKYGKVCSYKYVNILVVFHLKFWIKVSNFQEKFLLESEIIIYCIAEGLLESDMEQNLFFLMLKLPALTPDGRNVFF